MSNHQDVREEERYDALYGVKGFNWSFGILFLVFIIATVVKYMMD
ncbi:YqzM family protein [Thermoflavimicrobium dichotomicum]|uniref:YqzM-like protein n=1 Tax=Thermoflavimicrobium dichotomicum TaxID=46223 RepID=A0A1I3PME0_9BACL|nr:YqzM family protein [Thermoflavimicrobium dichotomicum]SFJ22672.1 YqzM-like protein [Thermoflavimicrobium dichotomicum]